MNLMKFTMNRYTLDKTSKKHVCPNCGKKRFVRYKDLETGTDLSPVSGRCDRQFNCAYHYPPREFFKTNNTVYKPILKNDVKNHHQKMVPSYHPIKDLENSLESNKENNFIKFLDSKFNSNQLEKVIRDYKIGTAKCWYNSTIFWQIDQNNKIRGGKMIKYKPSGKRTKYINWFHSHQIKNRAIDHFNLEQCLFGLHLINDYNRDIAIVESEKTACLMSIYFDKYLWLATGSLSGLSKNKLKPLKDRKIILYPDLGLSGNKGTPYEQWEAKSVELRKNGYDIVVSHLLENKANYTDRQQGLDIADYFLK